MSVDGEPTHACLAKQLFAQHVQYGDQIGFPTRHAPDIDSIIAWNDQGRRSGVFVNTTAKPCKLRVADWDDRLGDCTELLRIDTGTGRRVVREPFGGTIRLDGYGVAVATSVADTELD
jgi:hypothetical protein